MVDERTSAAGEVVLLDDGDFEASFCEARCCCDAADAGAWVRKQYQ